MKVNLSAQQPTVFDYSDYKKYLRDFYLYRKNKSSGYSYRKFSIDGGFKSPNILKLVIDKERNIGNNSIPNFIKALGLSGKQADYFATLVRLRNAKSDFLKDDLVKFLKTLLPQTKRKTLDKPGRTYLNHWLYPVIRELACLKDFSLDPHWIHNLLYEDATIDQIRECLHFLIDRGFIKKNANGRYYASDAIIESTDEIDCLEIRNFHRMILDQAKHSVDSVPLNEREFGAFTISTSRDKIPVLKEKLKNFRHEIYQLLRDDQDKKEMDSVVQVNFQMYPHCK